MQFVKNLTIGRRIFFGLGLIVLILVVQGLLSVQSINTAGAGIAEIEKKSLPGAVLLGKINTSLAELSGDELRYSLATTSKEREDLESVMNSIIESIKADQQTYRSLIAAERTHDEIDNKEQELYKSFEADWNEFVDKHLELLALVAAGQTGKVAQAAQTIDELFDTISGTLGTLIALNEQHAEAISQEVDGSFAATKKTVYIGILLAILLAVVAGWYMRLGASSISSIVNTSVEQLTKLSLALSASTQQASAGAQQNAAIAQQVAAGATQQSKQAEEISRALSQMSETIQKLVAISQEVSDTTTQASKLAQQTGESTEKISKMVEVVTTTAEQTNLLALNAAIEAARAGDAGRGFAVVADEVRKLADSSSKAADDVQQIVKEIGGSISVTVESIGKSSLKIGDVAVGITQQSGAISEIAKTMDSIASVAEQSASGAQQLSASTQQTSAATQQVAAASTELQRLASQLQKLVGGRLKTTPTGPLNNKHPDTPTIHRPSMYHAAEAQSHHSNPDQANEPH